MESGLITPAHATFLGIPTMLFSILIPLLGTSGVIYLIIRRLAPLFNAAPDSRHDRIIERLVNTFTYPHHRMPRYMFAGAIHITILSGFIIISLRWIELVFIGIFGVIEFQGIGELLVNFYRNVKDLSASLVLIACITGIIRRGIFKPARYTVPPRYGEEHTWETLVGLFLIAALMICDMFFQGSLDAARIQKGLETGILIPGTGIWFAATFLSQLSLQELQNIHLSAFYAHELIFFFFLCFLPFGRFFHLVVSIPTLFSMRLNKGTIKPVKHGVSQDQLDGLESFGVKKFEDFTWKHMLDFYACADCGRCSDRCPANAAGRPLSPRFISIKARNYAFKHYPLFGCNSEQPKALIGDIYSEDEIWSCTTCGACEEECPLMIEYIDKIVDLRRGMVDEGMVPQSLQKPLGVLEKRGNPWGKMEKKRADWTKDLPQDCRIKILERGESAETLYFVDSISSFDDRMQDIARSTAQILHRAGIDFGILGKAEKDSGHEARRFGEEMLFQDLKDRNTEAILNAGVKNIITADPHAFNALRNDYHDLPPVEHISQTITRSLKSGKIGLKAVEDQSKIYAYHDPCYLGRHNELYDDPREAIDAIPGIKRVEMKGNCKDRSFCCGGGGLMLFYEPEEEQRMGVLRVKMVQEAGANVIVTACPFCLVNIEDAIKVCGLEGEMETIDLAELIERHLITEA